jgi:TonB-linked SusC/RagA family outer membrane protein
MLKALLDVVWHQYVIIEINQQAFNDLKLKHLLNQTLQMYKNYRKKPDIPAGYVQKIWLIMRLTTVILIASLMQVSAATFSQRISLNEFKAPLETVLSSIKKQSGYVFFTRDIDLQKTTISIKVRQATIEETMEACFKDLPYEFKIEGKNVVITRKEPSFLERVVATLTSIDVSGRVVDAEGKPLPGASVKVKSSGKSVSANSKGEFLLRGVEDGTLLVVSFIGYVSKEVDAAKEMGNVVLEISDSKLDEVQVIAYGTTTRRLSTGNIGTVTAKEIERQPVSNPLLALQGRVPGLVITQDNGIPGGGVTVRIQGQNSIGSGNDPFYVIDGVPYVSQMLATTNGGMLGNSGGPSGSGTGNPMSYINPSDIESIDVLKDADATAIYGSRAANGAILITTKKGKAGNTKVDVNLQNGWGKVTNRLDLMNTEQYLEMRREALRNDGITTPAATDYDINGLWDQNRDTDWQKELIGGTAQYTNVNGTISGGTNTVQYLVGGTYHRETTVFPGDFSDTKSSMNFNLNSISEDQKFKMTLSGNYLIDNNQLPILDLFSVANQLPPNAPALYNSDGTPNWAPNTAGASSWKNPLAQYTFRTYQNKTNNLLGNFVLSYEILPNLELKSSFAYNNLQTNEFTAYPINAERPEDRQYGNSAVYSNSTIRSWIIEPLVNYRLHTGNGKLDVLLGSTIQYKNSNGQQFTGIGYNTDAVLEDIKSASTFRVNSTVQSIYNYNAIYGRVNYNLQDKYILNLTARRDGSSRFGSADMFHNFGALGIAWIFSNEDLLKNNVPWLSFGKFKGSYGTTGNDQIGDYSFLNLYNPTDAGVPYQGNKGLEVMALPNPYLQWEETRKLNLGVDLGFVNDRILFTGNYAFNRSSNQLLSYALPFVTGFEGIIQNFPATVQNSAWEFTLSTINSNKKYFIWKSYFNLTIPKNILVAFPGLETSTYANDLTIGLPLGYSKSYHYLGVDPLTGVYQMANKDGNPTSSPDYAQDATVVLSPFPKFYGGLENNFGYKGFHFDMIFVFVKQTKDGSFFGNSPGIKMRNQPASVWSRWQKSGDNPSVQRFNSNSSLRGGVGDQKSINGSYIRLKNISLSCEIPTKWINAMGMANLRISAQGQNLITISKFSGFDPESSTTLLKVFTLGLQATL